MKALIRILIPVLLIFAVTSSFAAESVHLMLKGSKGKTYKVKTDAKGKFEVSDLEPDTYELIWILPDGTSPDNAESASIEIESFSWGMSNQRTVEQAAAQAAPGTGSSRPTSGPTGGAPTGQPTPPPGMGTGGGEGARGGKITKSRSNIQNNRMSSEFKSLPGGKYYVVVLEDVVISSMGSSCEGTCGRMAINEKGLPGEKGTKKGNK